MDKQDNNDLVVNNQSWERKVIEKLVFSSLKEQRRARFWRILFRIISIFIVLYMGWMLYLFNRAQGDALQDIKTEHLAVITIDGEIAADSLANAQDINQALEKAFQNAPVKAVILSINSPGGSPVQADLINKKIYQLKKQYNKPVYVVAQELCASAAYYIAVAADEIYANPSSLVGSVGVIMSGFGYDKLLDKIGVDRRLYTAGVNKALLDPFSPENEQQVKYIQQLLAEVHKQFIAVVKQGRQDKINIADEQAFSGLFWSGAQAAQNGFVDKLGGVDDIAQLYDDIEIYDYSPQLSTFELLSRRLETKVKTYLNNTLSYQ